MASADGTPAFARRPVTEGLLASVGSSDLAVWTGAHQETMQTTDGVSAEVFGLYELSKEGTILYSRPRSADGLHDAAQETVGQDFFRDIFVCRNNEDLRRHFRRFITGDQPVDTFVFDCLFDQEIVRAKVFMTRAYEHDLDHTGGIVIMDIRRAV